MRKGALLLAVVLASAISTNAMAAKKGAVEVRDPYYMKWRALGAVLTLWTITPLMTAAIDGLDKEPVVRIKK